MRAKQINEFKQGGNPYDTMGLGAWGNIRHGSMIIVLVDLWRDQLDLGNLKKYGYDDPYVKEGDSFTYLDRWGDFSNSGQVISKEWVLENKDIFRIIKL
jgi:hypothetical protein